MNAKPRKQQRQAHLPTPIAPQPSLTPASPIRAVGPVSLSVVVLLFLALRAYALAPHPADEGIYFYGALRWSQGVWPYRDFFHAHPPLHLLPNALLFRVFGFGLLLAKAPTFLAAAFCGVAAYLIVCQLGAARSLLSRQIAGVVAATALLFAESTLKAAATDTGIQQACAWVALAALLLTYNRCLAAGVAAAAAPLTLIQAGPAALVVVAASLLLGRKAAVRTFLGAATLFMGVHAVMWALAGTAFWQQVYGFHLEKVGAAGEGARHLGFVAYDNWTLIALAMAGALALLMGPRRGRALGAVATCAAVFTVWAMVTRPRVFPFYFQPAFFPLSLLVGLGAAQVIEGTRSWWQQRPRAWPTPHVWAPVAAMVLLLGPFHHPVANALSPRRAEQLASYAQSYQWINAPGVGPLNQLVSALFWQQGIRVAGQDANAVTQYLWQRSRWLDCHPDLVSAVAAHAQVNPQTSLLGDSTVAPLVALQAGVPIAGDLVDTNMQRLKTGNLTLTHIFSTLDAHPEALLVLGKTGGIGTLPDLRAFVARHYEPAGHFTARTGATYNLWRRR